jgi:hypothetical protein
VYMPGYGSSGFTTGMAGLCGLVAEYLPWVP